MQLDTTAGRQVSRAPQGRMALCLTSVGVFSLVVNLLMLTGPLFMVQVYDRVLASRSLETLTALFLIAAFLIGMQALIDLARHRVMHRVAHLVQSRLERRVFTAGLQVDPGKGGPAAGHAELRDLEAVRRLLASPLALAIFDLPWTPLFLLAIFALHPALGMVSLAGGAVLIAVALLNQRLTGAAARAHVEAAQVADHAADLFRSGGEVVGALGMRDAAFRRWQRQRVQASVAGIAAADRGQALAVLSRGLRLLLQSALLAVGAWLCLLDELSPGAMLAASVVMGRALAPLEQAVTYWGMLQHAREGWARLQVLLRTLPEPTPRTLLPRPEARLEVSDLSVLGAGGSRPVLRGLSFRLGPGEALGVIGATGAGKTTLARALIGSVPLADGQVRLGGAPLGQYDPDMLGRLIGYLPQQIHLFEGSVADNIARLAPGADPAAVIEAARRAAAHQAILDLPHGYDTVVGARRTLLSGGQLQRIGLARALFGDPVLLVLDEPNANLDHDGSQALNAAIRQLKARGAAVIVMAHRPAAITECDWLMILEQGESKAFGPRDEVLRAMVHNADAIRRATATGMGGIR